MDKLLFEKNRLEEEKDQLESAFLKYKNVTAPALLLAKDIERNEKFKFKLELINELKAINAQLREKNSEKAKLTEEIGLLKMELINLSEPAKSKEPKKFQTDLKDKEILEKKDMEMPARSKAKDRKRKTVHSCFNCEICHEGFTSKRLKKKHVKEKHQEVHTSFNCDICHKSFKSKSLIYQHVKGVHPEVNSSLNCNASHKSIQSKSILYRHVKEVNEEVNSSLDCDIYNKNFESKNAMQVHSTTVHSSLFIICDICKRKVKGKQGIKAHTREVHSEVRFRCTVCLKSSKSARCFRAHFQKIHKGGKHPGVMSFAEEYIPEPTDIMPTLKTTCDMCKKQFNGKDELRAHEREFHSEVLFKCTGCFESFKTARCFRQHFQMIHKGGNHPDVMSFAEEYNPDDIMPVLERQI